MRLGLTLLALSCAISCPSREASVPPVDRADATAAATEPEFRPTATIQELMDGTLDPAADVLWDAVATISRRDGVEERRPQTDEQWWEVRRHALLLLEATNLLILGEREVSRSYLPGSDYGDLDSNAIKEKIAANRPAFVAFAHGVHDATSQMLRAIDAHDADKLFELGSQLDQACESCHMVFWFPKRTGP